MVMAQLRGWDLLSIHPMSCEGSPCYPVLPQIRGSGRKRSGSSVGSWPDDLEDGLRERWFETSNRSSVLHLDLAARYFDTDAGNAIHIESIGQPGGGDRGAPLVHVLSGHGAAYSVQHIDVQG